jgi:hypothetical protein
MTGYHFAMTSRLFLLALFLALPLGVLAQEQAFTTRSTELKDRGAADGATLSTLAENTPVKVVARGGGWTRVEAGGQSGFVRVFHLRFPARIEASSGSSSAGGDMLSSLGAAITGQRADPKANLATTGVRGLSREQLQNAAPNPERVREMQSYRADRSTAERFAREGKLAATPVDNPEGARR